jgi:hypothetical protein
MEAVTVVWSFINDNYRIFSFLEQDGQEQVHSHTILDNIQPFALPSRLTLAIF